MIKTSVSEKRAVDLFDIFTAMDENTFATAAALSEALGCDVQLFHFAKNKLWRHLASTKSGLTVVGNPLGKMHKVIEAEGNLHGAASSGTWAYSMVPDFDGAAFAKHNMHSLRDLLGLMKSEKARVEGITADIDGRTAEGRAARVAMRGIERGIEDLDDLFTVFPVPADPEIFSSDSVVIAEGAGSMLVGV